MNAPARPEAVPEDFVSGNVYDKYRTKNPIARWLMQGFLSGCRELLRKIEADRVLEVGCGPGDLAGWLLPTVDWCQRASYLGTDVSTEEVAQAKAAYPSKDFLPASIYDLPAADRSFDCVIACEVFEHLEDPQTALDEVARVSSKYLLISVPWEPVWRVLNLARGQYISDLGNTPGHLQHFSRAALRRLVSTRFEILDERHPLPWTILLARVRQDAAR